jgi:hypothetical protein
VQTGQGLGIPDGYKLNLLIRTTVIAVNQANKTGNYTVLRDLAAPGFQGANNPAQLGEVFAELRKRNYDLSPVLFYQPKFSSRPMLLPNGLMRLVGHFPTRPLHVTFDLIFEQVQGEWRIYAVSVGAQPADPVGGHGNAPDAGGGPAAEAGSAGGTGSPAAANTDKTAAPSVWGEKLGNAAPKAAGKEAAKSEPAMASPAVPTDSKQGPGAPAAAAPKTGASPITSP